MHLSPGHEWLLWITSTTLCSPSPFPVKGGGRRAKKSRHRWIPFLQPLPACGGQDAIGSALRASWSCSLSNRKQERQTAEPCSEACVRLCETEASTVCGTCSARSPAPSGTQQQDSASSSSPAHRVPDGGASLELTNDNGQPQLSLHWMQAVKSGFCAWNNEMKRTVFEGKRRGRNEARVKVT